MIVQDGKKVNNKKYLAENISRKIRLNKTESMSIIDELIQYKKLVSKGRRRVKLKI